MKSTNLLIDIANNIHNDTFSNIDAKYDLYKQQLRKEHNHVDMILTKCEVYILTLSLINDLLANMGYNKINYITDFKNVKRTDIELESNNGIIEKYLTNDKLFKYFNKPQLKYYDKDRTKCYTLSILRVLIPYLGYQLNETHQNKTIEKGIYTRIPVYSINN
jgi:hypothetical protein